MSYTHTRTLKGARRAFVRGLIKEYRASTRAFPRRNNGIFSSPPTLSSFFSALFYFSLFVFSFSFFFFSCRWVFCVSRSLRLNPPENGPRSSLEGSFVQRGFRGETLAMAIVSMSRSGVSRFLDSRERVVEISYWLYSIGKFSIVRGGCNVSQEKILNFNMVEVISFHLKVSRFLLFIRSSVIIRKSEYIPY